LVVGSGHERQRKEAEGATKRPPNGCPKSTKLPSGCARVAPVTFGFTGVPFSTIREFPTSHVPMLSQPKAVAAVIMDAAAKANAETQVGAR
jgi:hypothetical protein